MLTEAIEEYLEFWKQACPGEDGLWIHPADRDLVVRNGAASMSAPTSFNHYTGQPLFGSRDGLRLGLVPKPHIGDVTKARLFILNLNPAFSHRNYFEELEYTDYRESAIRALRDCRGQSFYILERRFAWTGGYEWWDKKWQKRWADISDAPFTDLPVAAVELFPYHSYNFAWKGWMRGLESVTKARALARALIESEERSVRLAVMRNPGLWGIDQQVTSPKTYLLPSSHRQSGYPDRNWLQDLKDWLFE